tara:strand:+ start:5530 stop:7014 length:1485 start_codon:yes stop_codon:yes gene_type:complete
MAKVVLEAEVKSNIKAVAKDQKAWNKELKKTEDSIKDVNKEGKEVVAEMQILGVSINGLKTAWKSAASGAKFLFRSIKMGIISTGVGIFVVAFATLATWFAKTKKGAEFLEVAFTGVGAAINVIVDRIAKFGGGIAKILAGDVKDGLKDMGDSFKNIGSEILTDTLYTMALKKEFQSLTDSQRDLNVETAKRRADIEELKLIAEDVTKSEQVRLKAAQDAFAIENKLLNDRTTNAEKALALEQKRQSTITDPQKEDLDKLAQLEIDLANIRGESVTKQIELNNKINAIQAEGSAKRIAELDARKTADQEAMGEVTKMARISIDTTAKLIKADEGYTAVVLKNAKTVSQSKKEFQRLELAAASQFAGALGQLAGENKALSGAQALINTYLAVTEVMKDKDIPSTTLKFLMAGTVLASGLANVKKIFATDVGGGGGGGGGAAASAASVGTPAPQMMQGAFTLGGGEAPEPARAYVVSDDITANQNKLAIIRRRATI